MDKSDIEFVERMYLSKEVDKSHKGVIHLLTEQIKSLHDFYQPEVIIFNESSAVPNGYVIREAWRVAYPDETPPKFYRVNPRALKKGKKDTEFFQKRIKNKDTRIFVYDESVDTGESCKKVLEVLRNIGYKSIITSASNLHDLNSYSFDHLGPDFVQKYREDDSDRIVERMNVVFSYGNYGDTTLQLGRITTKGYAGRTGSLDEPPYRKHILKRAKKAGKFTTDDGLRGIVIGTLRVVDRYKYLGKRIGERIIEEKEKHEIQEKKEKQSGVGLENILSIIVIFSLIGSLVFLQSNITGNVIADLSTNITSLVGGVLLVVGLVAGFFWLKKNEK